MNQNEHIPEALQEIKTEVFHALRLGPHLVENIIHDNVTLDVADIRELKRCNLQLSGGGPDALLVSSGKFSSITKEGRELSADHNFSKNTIAKAMIIHSLSQRMIAKFYIQFNKPREHTEIFASRQEALIWLTDLLRAHFEAAGKEAKQSD